MFLTTHSVFEQLLLYDHDERDRERGPRRPDGGEEHQHGAWVECLGRPGAAPV
jgi:hypothetical protein